MSEQPRKLYLDGGKSIGDIFRTHVRWLKASVEKESQAEKPYAGEPYRQMHLNLPQFKWPPWRFEPAQLPEGAGYGIFRTHTFLFPFPRCSLFVRSLHCKETGSGSASVLSTPPTSQDSHYSWRIWSKTRGADVDPAYKTFGRMAESVEFTIDVTDAELEKAEICGEADFSGHASTALQIEQPVPFAIPFLFDPVLEFTAIEGYSSRHTDCGCVDAPIECAQCECLPVTIGYTTQQMAVDGVQTLTVEGDPYDSKCHTWSLKGGGGSLFAPDVNGDIVYTAPATNANCLNNPTIALSCGGTEVDTLKIAVNKPGTTGEAVFVYAFSRCLNFGSIWNCYINKDIFDCDGTFRSTDEWVHQVNPCASCAECMAYDIPPISPSWDDVIATSPVDNRNQAMKDNGCCPEQLL